MLSPTGIDHRDIEKTLDQMIVNDIDYADLYFEFSQAEAWVLEEGIIREGSHSIDQGVGVRAVSEDKSGFAYSDEIILPALTDAARAARAIAGSGGKQKLQAWQNRNIAPLYSGANPLDSIPSGEKIALLQRIDADTRKKDPRIKQVIAGLSGSYSAVLIAGSDGCLFR